jgi:dTDP-glucose 4,6-dehydratase
MPRTIESPARLFAEDLEHVLLHTAREWNDLRGQRLFITGGTGFFGRWLLESFAYINDRLRLQARAMLLSRDPTAWAHRMPHLADHPAIDFVTGDVRNFAFPHGTFSHIIHAATDASSRLNQHAPTVMFDTIVAGTRRTLDFALACGATTMLQVSSGAVYGPQPPELSHMSEDYRGAPDVMATTAAYGEGKRAAELHCAAYHRQHGLDVRVARCFAFVGAGLPLDAHFAVGNFLRDALHERPVEVASDGRTVRSYLYAADLAIWLWTILFRGAPCRPYNAGSDQAVSILDVATTVASLPPQPLAVRHGPRSAASGLPPRYVPSIERARRELGLEVRVPLETALRRTLTWHQQQTVLAN